MDDAQANRGYARTPPAEPEPFWPPDEAEAKARHNGPDGAARFAPRMPFPTAAIPPVGTAPSQSPPDGAPSPDGSAPDGSAPAAPPPGAAGSPWAQPLTPQPPAPRIGPAGPPRPISQPPPAETAEAAQPTSPGLPGQGFPAAGYPGTHAPAATFLGTQAPQSPAAPGQGFPAAAYPGTQAPQSPAGPGHAPPGQVQAGHVQPGHAPPGQIPAGHVSPGHVSPGHVSPGHVSPGQAEAMPPSGDWAAASRPPAPPQAGQSLFTVPAWKTAPTTEPAPDPLWTHEPTVPTAEEFARRRATRPADPVASMGMRAAVNKSMLGLVKLPPNRREQEYRHDVDMVRRNFGGLRQVTVVNPKGGAGKTVAALLLAMTFGQKRGGYVLAWDNNETQGTLGMRAQQDFHVRTVRDLLRDLDHFAGAQGRVGDLSQYVRAQGEGMFDVLASDESATAGEMLTGAAFSQIRDVVSRFYKLIVVDTGNNVRATNWQAAIDATDQLVVTMSARNDSAETAARMLDHLEQTGRHRLVRQAVTVVSMPPSRRELDVPAVQRHFAARTRTVVLAPYEPLIDSGEPIRYGQLSAGSREAWLKIAAAVAEGL